MFEGKDDRHHRRFAFTANQDSGVGPVSLLAGAATHAAPSGEEGRTNRAFSYQNDKLPEGPWSIHLIKIERGNPDYELHSMLANGAVTGMTTLSDQVKALPASMGRPMAAINGDFYSSSPKAYNGDPQEFRFSKANSSAALRSTRVFGSTRQVSPRPGSFSPGFAPSGRMARPHRSA